MKQNLLLISGVHISSNHKGVDTKTMTCTRYMLIFFWSCGDTICRERIIIHLEISKHQALFSSKIFCKTGTVALSFVFDKYYPIMH